MAIASDILDVALRTALEHNAGRVLTIKVLIGEMAGVEPEALQFCFETLAEGTVAAAATLTMERTPLTGFCRQCRQQFSVMLQDRFFCPHCHTATVDIVSGRELYVEQIEVD